MLHSFVLVRVEFNRLFTLDFFKAVLASFKEGPQKIYIGDGVYADPVLMYQDGEWIILPWTFPDFRTGLYNGDLSVIRGIYRKKRRSLEST